ncbi:MAG: hypothetical protein ABIM99_00945, partial [Candidatus Dojkabacteria bacterium]
TKTETTPTSEVKTESSKVTETSVPEKKGGNKIWLFCCCGCLALLVLCVGIIVGVYLLAPTALNSVLKSTNVLPSSDNLTKIDSSVSSETLKQNSTAVDNKLKAAEADLASKPSGSKVTVNLSPEELIYALFANSSSSDISQYVQYVSVGMENSLLTAQVDVGNLINALKQNPDASSQLNSSPVDLSLLNGMQVRVELTVTADGKGLKIQSVTTGNSLIDTFINSGGTLDSADSEINNAFSGFFENATIDNIVITHNNLALTLIKN